MRRLLAVTLLLTGCVAWTDPKPYASRRVESSAAELRRDELPGTGAIGDLGNFTFTVDEARLCQRHDRTLETTVQVQHKKLSTPGLVAALAGAALVVSGISFVAKGDSGSGITQAVIGGAILGYVGYQRFLDTSRKGNADEKQIADDTTDSRCDGDVAEILGPLTMTTPWGETLVSPVVGGKAEFRVDWAHTGIDAYADGARDKIRVAWRVASEKLALVTQWQPPESDADRAITLIASQAPEPPDLVVTGFEIDGGQFLAGKTQTLKLTIENRGAGAAVDVKADTRSSIAELHGQHFVFGDIPGKETRTRTIEVATDAHEGEATATIVLAFSEAKGRAPANYTAKFPVTREVCPEGRLTRKQYKAKRDALKKALAAGGITQEEFERYDAELVGCLE